MPVFLSKNCDILRSVTRDATAWLRCVTATAWLRCVTDMLRALRALHALRWVETGLDSVTRL